MSSENFLQSEQQTSFFCLLLSECSSGKNLITPRPYQHASHFSHAFLGFFFGVVINLCFDSDMPSSGRTHFLRANPSEINPSPPADIVFGAAAIRRTDTYLPQRRGERTLPASATLTRGLTRLNINYKLLCAVSRSDRRVGAPKKHLKQKRRKHLPFWGLP